MGCLAALGLTAIAAALGVAMSALTGLFMGLATTIATSAIGFIAFLLILI
jgi:hypothetical protein